MLLSLLFVSEKKSLSFIAIIALISVVNPLLPPKDFFCSTNHAVFGHYLASLSSRAYKVRTTINDFVVDP
jgi:hypothetical protein